jgi:predicted metalloendopeptidase
LDILQGASVVTEKRSQLDQKIGDAYAACMDTATIEKRGLEPIKPELDHIRAMENASGVMDELVRLHRMGIQAAFVFAARPDQKDSNRTIAALSQGGLSLPDREYYLKTDAKSVETRARFLAHITKMFQLEGESAEESAQGAQMVMDIETILAKDSMDRVTQRDPLQTYHIMTKAQAQDLAPNFPWEAYWKAVGAPQFETLNVSQPDFFKKIATDLQGQPMAAWRAYFGFHLLHSAANELPAAFEKEEFDFWSRYLTGAKEPRPRTSRCVLAVDRQLGDLLGQKYVELTFGADAKAQITQLVDAMEKAMGEDIHALPWMTDETKLAALEKLKAITNNVGAPRTWRKYAQLTISRDDFLGNGQRAATLEHQHHLDKIGKATDKTEWRMTTPTVNAFYSPETNSINFPAGILQPPFFDPRRDVALNYGGIGAVIGHEMTHGFDDQGRKFDGSGNLRDWWTAKDRAEFEKRAACVADEYSSFTAVDDVKLNGRLTLGENTADNGGLRIALLALQSTLGAKAEKVDGFTAEQRLFLGFAQVWCENSSAESSRARAIVDPHSPGRYRVDGTLQNMPEFQKAFSCKAEQPMVSANACRVW